MSVFALLALEAEVFADVMFGVEWCSSRLDRRIDQAELLFSAGTAVKNNSKAKHIIDRTRGVLGDNQGFTKGVRCHYQRGIFDITCYANARPKSRLDFFFLLFSTPQIMKILHSQVPFASV